MGYLDSKVVPSVSLQCQQRPGGMVVSFGLLHSAGRCRGRHSEPLDTSGHGGPPSVGDSQKLSEG